MDLRGAEITWCGDKCVVDDKEIVKNGSELWRLKNKRNNDNFYITESLLEMILMNGGNYEGI